MADERRKGPSDRRRGRTAKLSQTDEQSVASPAGPDGKPNEGAAAAADELEASIRARQQEGYGEVL